ncbi:MAG: 4-alpha-glucanotransferase [Desulfofustis sp.]|jgi:4-alpha-glucanotransferase|nr:4-alpha-glucanotransferase [Desulfofustis sp.]
MSTRPPVPAARTFLHDERASGILAHLTSLPGPFGIGDIGPAALAFLDFLAAAGQRYWQILPTCPTNPVFDNSPYMSTSARAGSPLLLAPQLLHDQGLITTAELAAGGDFSPYLVDYQRVARFKSQLLDQAFHRFSRSSRHADLFADQPGPEPWMQDFALFMAIKEAHRNAPWFSWPRGLARREPKALAKARAAYRSRIEYYLFEQRLFLAQWSRLRKEAAQRTIRLIGDIPIYIGLDSADVWAHTDLFELHPKTLQPLRVAGVPPDYFSATGQRWGNPLYRWHSNDRDVQKHLIDWWVSRLRCVFDLVDVVRIDHFRAFESYWAVPADEETALNGTWEPGPGAPFFHAVQDRLGPLDIIAEDLGDISPEVIALRDSLDLPGMKVLQFAFDGNPANPFLPYNFTSPRCVVYTGTHDNDTTLGWFLSERLSELDRQRIKRFANREMHDHSPIHEDLLYLALSSIAALAVTPLQDLLGFGSDCRMNTPGVPEGNWRWRCAAEFLTNDLAARTKEITQRFGR